MFPLLCMFLKCFWRFSISLFMFILQLFSNSWRFSFFRLKIIYIYSRCFQTCSEKCFLCVWSFYLVSLFFVFFNVLCLTCVCFRFSPNISLRFQQMFLFTVFHSFQVFSDFQYANMCLQHERVVYLAFSLIDLNWIKFGKMELMELMGLMELINLVN